VVEDFETQKMKPSCHILHSTQPILIMSAEIILHWDLTHLFKNIFLSLNLRKFWKEILF